MIIKREKTTPSKKTLTWASWIVNVNGELAARSPKGDKGY
jgi:hypothetical protein